jgi:hypothetical protein
MTLLGAPAMDRGYQTESMAEHTLEVIWCLEDHCPASARDWDAQATASSCRADVHNLAGFVSRKRPEPQLDKAREYYDEALGYEPCPLLTLSAPFSLPFSCALTASHALSPLLMRSHGLSRALSPSHALEGTSPTIAPRCST